MVPGPGSWLIIGSSPSEILARTLKCSVRCGVSTAIERYDDLDVWVGVSRRSFEGTSLERLGILHHRGGRVVTTVATFDAWMRNTSGRWPNGKGMPGWIARIRQLHRTQEMHFYRGEYANSAMSGPLAVQYAIYNGCRELHIVGFEGKDEGIRGAYVEQAKVLTRIAAGCPDCRFVYYGEMVYPVEGPNVTLCHQPQPS